MGVSSVLVPLQVSAQATNVAGVHNADKGDAGRAITITARRRQELVQDVPIIIETLTADQIEAHGIANVEDIAKFTPGLVFDQGINLQDTRPVIRGLPATRGRPPVGILLDSIDISTEALGDAGDGSLCNCRSNQ